MSDTGDETNDPGVTIAKVVATYIKIRDKRAENKKEFEAHDQKLKDQMETLSGFLLQTMRASGAESVRTKHGTVFTSIDITPQGQDWDKFYAWVAENNAFEALERRIKKTFIATYMEENDGELPPGVGVFRQHSVNIRRNSKE